jgi:Fe2+ transport system protein FeoA
MTNKKMNSKDPGIIASEKALRRAARRALQLGLQTGTPVYVIKKGRIVDLTKLVRRKTIRKK